MNTINMSSNFACDELNDPESFISQEVYILAYTEDYLSYIKKKTLERIFKPRKPLLRIINEQTRKD